MPAERPNSSAIGDPTAWTIYAEQLEAELLAAQEREKALREALERIAQPSADVLTKVELAVFKDVARAVLAAFPSEKPGSLSHEAFAEALSSDSD